MAVTLLDTNALYWYLTDNKALGRAARNRIEGAPILAFSAASVFELILKSQKIGKNGKPQIRVQEGFAMMAIAAGLHEIPVRSEHSLAAKHFLGFESGDPIDRMILAQAAHERALLITSDEKMLALGYDWIIDAQV
jgi:PIN domain nuclease of toxin-antitoxin system